MTTLDALAKYVELQSLNDAQKLMSSGFELASTTRVAAVPEKTAILSVSNVSSGKLGLELQSADNAWCYVVEFTPTAGGTPRTATFTNVRNILLTGLASGTTYSLRAQVMGSGNQTTEWSDAVQHMAT